MASETGFSDQFQSSVIQELLNSRNRGVPLFFPFIFGFNSTNPHQENQDQASHGESRDRVILINPFAQSMFVMETSGAGLESLFADILSRKNGQRPASKAAIDAMPSVEIAKDDDDEQCAVCLEEWKAGDIAKEMPCKHRFHGECIEKWLKISGSCPLCRYEMPVDEDEDASRKTRGENDGERRRGIWVSFNFGGGWRNRENFQNNSDENRENNDSSSSNHHETEA